MPELPPLLPEKMYHIYNHANGSENLFRVDENYYYFLQKYGEYIYPIAETYAYCLMPNHFHLMLKIRSEEEVLAYLRLRKPTLQGFQTLEELVNNKFSKVVSQQFSHFFNAYTQAYNNMYDRKGSLFIPPFKRKAIENDVYFTQLIAYIHLNPIKHGFCKNILEWKHSSFHAYYFEKPSKLNRTYLSQWFGNKKELIDFHLAYNVQDIQFEF